MPNNNQFIDKKQKRTQFAYQFLANRVRDFANQYLQIQVLNAQLYYNLEIC